MGESVVMHTFDGGRKTERRWAWLLDDWILGQGYALRRATPAEDRKGTDRFVLSKHTNGWVGIDYKIDARAADTGNAFIETVSVDTRGVPGWAVKEQGAEWVLYFVVPKTVYAVKRDVLRASVAAWRQVYRTASAQNDGYRTHGLLVPLEEGLAPVCEYIADIDIDGPVLDDEVND